MGRLLSCWLVVFEVMPEERDWLLERRIVKSEMGVGINDEPNRGAFFLLPGNPHIILTSDHLPTSRRVRSTRPSGGEIGIWKAGDHDITKVAPAFWAIPVLEKTPSAASIDRSAERFCRRLFLMLRPVNRGLHVRGPFRFRHCQPGRKNQIWLRIAEILQRGQEKIHVSFAFRRADVAARSAGVER